MPVILPGLHGAETRRGGTSPAFQLLDLEQKLSTSARKHSLDGLLTDSRHTVRRKMLGGKPTGGRP